MKIYTPNPRTNQAGRTIFAVGSFLCLVGLVGYLSIKGIDIKKPALTGDYTDSLYIWHETNDGIEVKLVPEKQILFSTSNPVAITPYCYTNDVKFVGSLIK